MKFYIIFFFVQCAILNSAQIHVGQGQKYANIGVACPFIKPGDSVFVHSGNYNSFMYYNGLKGTSDNWITITRFENDKVVINGGWQFTSSEFIRIEKLKFQTNENYNNTLLHFDHAGDCNKLSNHIIIDSCSFYDVQGGNTFKLGGASDFVVSNCKFINNTSIYAGIALNESRNGVIRNCYFENIKTKGIQFKLGTANILVYANYFKNAGLDDSALKIGENGGKEYYCPDMKDWHAKDIKIYSNIIVGGKTPFSIGLAVNSEIINNTISTPTNFVLRLLSDETDYENKNNKILNNIFYLDKTIYFNGTSGAKNIDFPSIIIQNNLFYCISKPNWKGPDPNQGDYDAEEIKGVQFINNKVENPLFKDVANEDFKLNDNSPALSAGMHVQQPILDYYGNLFKAQRSIGAIESGSILQIVDVQSIALNANSISIFVGNTSQLQATVLPKDATNQNVNWTTSDDKIASISQSGLLNALKMGNTKIIVISIDGNFRDTCEVEVLETSAIKNDNFSNIFLISPNPASDFIEINLGGINPMVNHGVDENVDINIYNTLGECVISLETGLRPVSTKVDISHLPIGLYFISIGYYSEKFVVVR